MRLAFLPLVLLIGCASAPGDSEEPDEPGDLSDVGGKADGSGCSSNVHGVLVRICNFHEVSPGIYRGARPTREGLLDLARLGVRTDVDLEKGSVADTERGYAADAKIGFAAKPMSYLFAPSDAQVDDLLSIINDPARQPVFFHCKLGNDRTGLIAALHRVYHQGWAPADAWNEMMTLGFHRVWVGLSHYFESRTGFED